MHSSCNIRKEGENDLDFAVIKIDQDKAGKGLTKDDKPLVITPESNLIHELLHVFRYSQNFDEEDQNKNVENDTDEMESIFRREYKVFGKYNLPLHNTDIKSKDDVEYTEEQKKETNE